MVEESLGLLVTENFLCTEVTEYNFFNPFEHSGNVRLAGKFVGSVFSLRLYEHRDTFAT